MKYSWKRCRRCVPKKPSPKVFADEKELQQKLNSEEAQKQGIEVYYCDEAGFSLTPSVPYAWQPVEDTIRIPSSGSKRLNVIGFYSKVTEKSFFQHTTGSVTSETIISAIDAFVEQRPVEDAAWRIIVMDNAPTHRSEAFSQKIDSWLLQRVGIHFLPAYSPELNAIEILWRFIKYMWLPITAYSSFSVLKSCVLDVLQNVGGKHRIIFK